MVAGEFAAAAGRATGGVPRQVSFYRVQRRFLDLPRAVLCQAAMQAYEQGLMLAWLAADEAAAAEVDQLLWQWPRQAFLPHQVAGADDDARCPLLILPGGAPPAERVILINERPQAALWPAQRVMELIPPDAAGADAARARWRSYRSRGVEPEMIDV